MAAAADNPWVTRFAPPLLGAPAAYQAAAGAAQAGDTGPDAGVQELYLQVGPQMDATNAAVQACGAMNPADVTVWQGQYAAWQSLQHSYETDRSAWVQLATLGLASVFQIYYYEDKFRGYLQTAAVWQQRVKLACPTYQPPPGPPTPPSPSPPPAGGSPPDGADKPWLCTAFGWNCPEAPKGGGGDAAPWARAAIFISLAVMVVAGAWLLAPALGVAVGAARLHQASRGYARAAGDRRPAGLLGA